MDQKFIDICCNEAEVHYFKGEMNQKFINLKDTFIILYDRLDHPGSRIMRTQINAY